MDNLVLADQEQITLQVLAQAEAAKVNGRIHGAQAEAAVVQVEQEDMVTSQITLEDTLDTLVEVELPQKDLQVELLEWLEVTIAEEDL
jgi:hypothetical protein